MTRSEISRDKSPVNCVDRIFTINNFSSQSVTTREAEGFKTETTLGADLKSIRVYEFTDTEMIVVSVISLDECEMCMLR